MQISKENLHNPIFLYLHPNILSPMDIELWMTGKTKDPFISNATSQYSNRLKHYCKFSVTEFPELKITPGISTGEAAALESAPIIKKILTSDFIILLDEAGEQFSSEQFASKVQKIMNQSPKRIIFIIGGPYGFPQALYSRANLKVSLSRMTFTHQMVRVFFTEQLYRAFTILRGESYHH